MIRVLTTLKWSAIDYERGTVFIDQGKGHKDRMIPIGERALNWIYKYQYDGRPQLTIGKDDGNLFVNYLGEAFPRMPYPSLIRSCQALDHRNLYPSEYQAVKGRSRTHRSCESK